MNEQREQRSMIWLALGYSGVWLVLLALLGVTAATAFLNLGENGAILHLGIAGLQIILIWALFMNLRRSSGLVRLCAMAGLFWLSFMFFLAFADYLTRDWNGVVTPFSGKLYEETKKSGADVLPN